MSIITGPINIKGQKNTAFKITCTGELTGTTALLIRDEIKAALKNNYPTIYIDTKTVLEADLSGVNEVIHTHYTLCGTSCKLVFLYRRNSVVEKWVNTTGLDKFIDTAIVPAS